MPKYSKNKGSKFVRKKKAGFRHPYELIHYLTTAREEGLKPMRDKAKAYLSGEEKPPIPLHTDALSHIAYNNPKYLANQSAHDFQTGKLGGSIASGVATIMSQVGHVVGYDKFMDFVGNTPKPKDRSLESQYAAYLVDQTYKNIDERPDEALGIFDRIPELDTDHISVWRNKKTNEMTVTVRGTKLSGSDLLQDSAVLFGSKHVDDSEFTALIDKMQAMYPNSKFDIAAHSLGCVYVMQEANKYSELWDDSYLFNPPSSPLQDDNGLRDEINNYGLDFYINHGDPLGSNTNHLMDPDTLQNMSL